MAELVLYDVRDRVAVVTVNDPERRNAVTEGMSAQLSDAVHRAEADDAVNAVVITGAGKAFCSCRGRSSGGFFYLDESADPTFIQRL